MRPWAVVLFFVRWAPSNEGVVIVDRHWIRGREEKGLDPVCFLLSIYSGLSANGEGRGL